MATVRKRKWTHNGQEKEAWVVAYTDQGGKRRIKTFDKKKDADRHRVQVEGEIADGTHVANGDTVTVKFAADDFLREIDRRASIGDGLTKTTVAGYRSTITCQIVPFIGQRKLADLDRRALQAFFDERAMHIAPGSVRNVHRELFAVLQHGVRSGWIRRNILRDDPVRLPEKADRRVRVPSKKELGLIFRAIQDRAHGEKIASFHNRMVIVTLAALCGLREGEILGLQWESVDFDADKIEVKNSLSRYDGLKAPKTRAGCRTIHLPPRARRALELSAQWTIARNSVPSDVFGNQRWRAWKTGFEMAAAQDRGGLEGFVVSSHGGKPISGATAYNELWKGVLKKAGLLSEGQPVITLHALRHAAASLWLEQKARPEVLTRLIGHSKISTTVDIYGHLFPEDSHPTEVVAAAAAQFDATTERQEPVTIRYQ